MAQLPAIVLVTVISPGSAVHGAADGRRVIQSLVEFLERGNGSGAPAIRLLREHLDTTHAPAVHPDGLTVRQVEVLRLIASGRSNKQISSQLDISQNTVARHVANIYEKVRRNNRVALASYAIEHGLLGQADQA